MTKSDRIEALRVEVVDKLIELSELGGEKLAVFLRPAIVIITQRCAIACIDAITEEAKR